MNTTVPIRTMNAVRRGRAGQATPGEEEGHLDMRSIVRRVALPIGAAALLGSGGFAFMAVNGVPESHAGAGENTISGYNVSNIHYAYIDNPGNPHLNYIKSVTFTLDHQASRASAQIHSTSADPAWVPYTDCGSPDGGYTWTCQNSTSQAADLAYFPGGNPHSDQLNVSAAQ
jgi:hypothetical protein